MRKTLAFIALAGLILRATQAGAKEAVLIQLSAKAAVIGPRVTLGEVASMIGGDRALAARLKGLDLGKAAPVGKTLKITPAFVKTTLRKEGYTPDQFQLSGEELTEVETSGKEFSLSQLLPEAALFIEAELKETPGNVGVTLAGPDKTFLLPDGTVKAKFRPSLTGQYEGTVFLTVELEVDGRLVRTIPLRLGVEVLHTVVMTTKRVDRGEVFGDKNTALARLPTSKMPRGAVAGMENVAGRKSSVALPPRAVIRAGDLFDPPVIKRWQSVGLVARRGNIEITVEAKALEDGKTGDVIRVENKKTHKVLRAKVLDEKTVLVGED